jgi:hypothetical protein
MGLLHRINWDFFLSNWEFLNRRVLIVMYPAFLKAIKPGYILKYSSWMETDLNN